VTTHIGAVESNSLFCTTYAPPATDLACCPHSGPAGAEALAITQAAEPAATTITAAATANDRLTCTPQALPGTGPDPSRPPEITLILILGELPSE
jgi:hypothetical protein